MLVEEQTKSTPRNPLSRGNTLQITNVIVEDAVLWEITDLQSQLSYTLSTNEQDNNEQDNILDYTSNSITIWLSPYSQYKIRAYINHEWTNEITVIGKK